MSAESLVKLKLSVWRDFAPHTPLTLWRADAKEQQMILSDSDIQQEVYSWQMREDPFDGISEEIDRMRLRELLLDRFEPSLEPSNRRIEHLSDFLVEADQVLSQGKGEWTISLDPPVEDEDAPYRLNSMLVLRNQVEWLVGIFGGLPGISVSIR